MEMKKIVLLLASAALALAAALSCNKVESPVQESGEGEYTEVTFNVNVDGVDVQTRAAGDLTGSESENKLTIVDIYVFEYDENLTGRLAAYKRYDANQISAEGGMTMKLKTDVRYTIYAIANELSSLDNSKKESSLLGFNFSLDSYDTRITKGNGFGMMSDAITKTFTDNDKSLSITLKRMAARVRLVNVTNNLPAAAGEVTIKNVFLSNVAATWCKSESEILMWYNRFGRGVEEIRSYDENITYEFPILTAEYAGCSLTFKSITDASLAAGKSYTSPVSLYCFANKSENVPDGFAASSLSSEEKLKIYSEFNGQHTMLVVETEIGGETYYYPIDLNKRINANNIETDGIVPNVGIERNKTYDVSLTINNYGSPDEPNREISTLTAGYTVAVGEWGDGGTIDADF